MNCEELLRQLAAYREGALPEGICAEIERHIGDCSPCAEVDQDLRDLARLCRESKLPGLPVETRRRIEALLGRRHEPPSSD